MKNTRSQIHIFKGIVLMLAVLFSLSPCTVKESVYQILDIEFQRPVNKTLSAQTPSTTCQIQGVSKATTSQVGHTSHFDMFLRLAESHVIYFTYFLNEVSQVTKRVIVDSSPPMYILYKQLRLGLA